MIRHHREIPADVQHALEASEPRVFWTDDPGAPERADPLAAEEEAALVIVGAGFSGLWAALHAVNDAPGRSVVVLEAETTGFGASSRNGGFLEASLTHGIANGVSHWPDELATLERLGAENFAAIVDLIRDADLDVGLEVTGATAVATVPWHVAELEEAVGLYRRHGERVELLDRPAMRARVDSPTYIGGLYVPDGTALVNPARLAWELRSLAESKGVVFHENSPVRAVTRSGAVLLVETPGGSVRARKVLVATNAYRGPVRSMRRYIVPVYDYVLMTEPLDAAQMASIGWDGREGLADASNQFHYYRLTTDNRILWGGYDAVYRFNNAVGEKYDHAGNTHRILAVTSSRHSRSSRACGSPTGGEARSQRRRSSRRRGGHP
jgi:glycine/D-amino acid oxidase-like deaminating enzyme